MENNTDPLQQRNPDGVAGKPLYPTAQASGNTLETLQAANTVPEQKKFDIKESIQELHTDKPIQNLRTFQSDIADAVQHKEASVVKIAAAEIAHNPNTKQMDDPKKSLYVLLLSGILVVSSIAALGIFFLYKTQKRASTLPKIETSKIIASEATQEIAVTPSQAIQPLIQQQKETISASANAITRLMFFTASATSSKSKLALGAQDFATRLNTEMPTWLIRALEPEYIVGIHTTESNNPFIIFKSSSYENAFAGMVKWEETIQKDLPAFVNPSTVTAAVQAPGITGSTTQTAVTTSRFQDGVIQNKDVRILKDASGKTILIYALPDKETIVIATNEVTLKELFARLITSQFVR